MLNSLITILKENQFLIAGLGISSMGLITFWVRDVPLKLYKIIKRQITTELIINNYDKVFYELLNYIKDNNKHKNFRTLKLTNGKWGDENISILSIGYGHHFLCYNHNLLSISYTKQTADSISSNVKETIILTKLGRNKRLFEDLLLKIEEKNEDLSKLKLYTMNDNNWNFSKYFRKRYMNSLFLESNKKELILSNLKKFQTKEEWYIKHGIPYQYGILLYGQPGTGKTSLIKAIASELNYNIFYLSPSELHNIANALKNCHEKSIVVIEDIDTCSTVHNRIAEQNMNEDSLLTEIMKGSLSNILNALDGLGNVHGRLLIATTNHIEKLDKALIRPGRFDLLIELNELNNEIIDQFFKFYFPKETIGLKNISFNKDISVATLQNMVLLGKTSQEILKEIQ